MKKNKQEMTMQQEMTTKTKFSNEVTVQIFDAVMLLRNTNLTALEMVEIISTLEDVLSQYQRDLNHNLCGLFSHHPYQKSSPIFPISPAVFGNYDEKISSQILQSELIGIVLDDLYNALVEAFPQDELCDDCAFCDGYLEDNVNVPDWAKVEAGIAPDAKLFLCVEEGSGHIMLEPTEYKHDITDIDEDMRMRLVDMGICLGEMNESIMDEEVIYRG
ncbi:hypothetical protein [Chakrabartyella piscis]|uniref:hypothetical protein n=1 Tax=Chakrabartyella piscis TaxID=2918914 RepID=UPI002958DE9B|nr:hypothetical protein [Chakrabartyella piscis]